MTPEAVARPRILLHFDHADERPRPVNYGLACVDVHSNLEIGELAPFARVAESEPAGGGLWTAAAALESLPVVYEGKGWIGGREVEVEARAGGLGHRLQLEDRTVLAVFERDREIVVLVSSGADTSAARFAALGPGLAIALALVGRFSLHASVVLVRGRVLVLLGESGTGKSTMARLASRRGGCWRVADDVVPVRVSARGELLLEPRFPQLKLESAEQWLGEEELRGHDLIAIRRESGLETCSFVELSRRDGVRTLLEGTVGSRLFSKELRRRELDTWVSAVGANRVLEWRVPEDAGRISESFDSLFSLEP